MLTDCDVEFVEGLVDSYEAALLNKADAQRVYEQQLSALYIQGQIDGKNAETRKAQESAALVEVKSALDSADTELKVAEARMSLYKAAWYALSGK